MYRTGPRYHGSAKKAATTTQCQKCLEYGHWVIKGKAVFNLVQLLTSRV
jgi:hypothetical protein